MRVVVTGSSGRIGRVVAGELARGGYEVVGVDLKEGEAFDGEFRKLDLRDAQHAVEVCRGAGAVVHLGNRPSIDPGSASARGEAFVNNTAATFNILQAIRACDVGCVVNASSIQAYGVVSNHYRGPTSVTPPLYFPIDEAHPLRPRDAYPLSKAMSESMVAALAEACPAVSAWSLRLPWVGAGAERERARSREEIVRVMAGGLGAILHPVECARAIRLCIESGRRGHTAVNLMQGRRATLPWTRDMLEDLYGRPVPFREDIEDGGVLFDVRKVKDVIGFEVEREV